MRVTGTVFSFLVEIEWLLCKAQGMADAFVASKCCIHSMFSGKDASLGPVRQRIGSPHSSKSNHAGEVQEA